jgi:aspartyl-tRNA(Asn)/glutamyl-tRNA(Gln) amidotransferase subunit A
LRALGATIVEVDIPFVRHAITMFLTITMVSGSHVHRRQLREHGDKYQPGTRLMLQAGQLIPAADYLQALKLRQRLKDAMRDTFRMHDLDAFISPTTSTTTSPLAAHAERMTYHAGEAGLADKARQTVPFNMTGQPALSIPCGFTDERLTIGLQIAGRPCDEVNVYRIAQAYENATEWHLDSPPI